MIKTLLIAIHLLLVSLFQWLSIMVNDVTITQNFPATVKAGETFTVDITIVKGELAGLAKLQQDLPEGFTATQVNTANATFSFKDRSVKFIWMSLPPDAAMKISYEVKVADNVPSGEVFMGGRFSYVVNNERKMASIPVKKLNVINSSPDAPTVSTDKPADETAEAPPATTTPAMVSAVRTVFPEQITGGQEFTVSIKINKDNVTGFAKIQETLPKGYSASGIETQGAIFSFVGEDVKFLWMNLPEDQIFTISYKVKAPATIKPGDHIEGAFTFQENEASKKYVIDPFTLKEGDVLAMDQGGTNDAPDEVKTDEPEVKEDPLTGEKITTPPVTPPTPPEKKVDPPKQDVASGGVTNIPPPQTGVFYRVQIMALQNSTVDLGYFNTRKKITETVVPEQHQGWNKYTVGKLSVYKDARDKREVIRTQNNVKNPFVTAYNGQKRITVQEALMITQQKWFR
ncbi:MAG: hypothetical protein KDD36_07300 [Flavobacteriales bacterium]|nr:hypothetical protein [Flavobacteriales bacterium]